MVRGPERGGGGGEKTTMQLSYRSIAVIVEPAIHDARGIAYHSDDVHLDSW